jgi:lipopolysaccharide transport system permease protein
MAEVTESAPETRSANADDQVLTVVDTNSTRGTTDLAQLWRCRELVAVLVLRDVSVRYKQTVLGAAWAIIQPLLAMIVVSVIFRRLAQLPSDGYPYPLFVYAALLPWTLFAGAVSACTQSLLDATDLLGKVYLPRMVLPLAALGSPLLDFLVASIVLVLLMVVYASAPDMGLLVAIPLLLAMLLLALGVGLFLAALTLRYRDFRFVLPFMLQIWMFATPVVYSHELIPAQWQGLSLPNPMSGLISGLRSAFLGDAQGWRAIAIAMLITMVMLLLGVRYFRRDELRFADVI